MEKDIYKLGLFGTVYISEIDKQVTRVPGGWIFTSWDFEKDDLANDGIFVPYNEEFLLISID